MKTNKIPKILIVDDEYTVLKDLEISLSEKHYALSTASSYKEAIEFLNLTFFDILITDLVLPQNSGIDLIKFAVKKNKIFGSILMTGYSDEMALIEAAHLGVKEILKKPFSDTELFSAIEKILEKQALEEENKRLTEKLKHENLILSQELSKKIKASLEIIGESPRLINALEKARIVAETQINCIIGGENGTGKELLAKYIHQNGPRKENPFVEVNCAALSPTLFEAELFGHKKGAFTNANESRAGFFEVADGGILFLDEITEIPFELQAKLLTAVEYGLIRRVGDTKDIKVNVQVIAATNRNINSLVDDGKLRRDLYHRLSEGLIVLPPLRERGNDIKILLDFYLAKYEQEFNKKANEIPKELWEKIINYNWPGNVRQLTNFIKKWVLFGEDTIIENSMDNIFVEEEEKQGIERVLAFDFIDGTFEELEKAKKLLIYKILDKYNGNKSQAARHLGLTYQGLLKMLKKFEENSESQTAD